MQDQVLCEVDSRVRETSIERIGVSTKNKLTKMYLEN